MSEERDYKEEYDHLRRLHESTNLAVAQLEKENSQLKSEIILLNNKLINCEQALHINKDIMRNALTRQNELTETHRVEVEVLRSEIKRLKEQLKE